MLQVLSQVHSFNYYKNLGAQSVCFTVIGVIYRGIGRRRGTSSPTFWTGYRTYPIFQDEKVKNLLSTESERSAETKLQ